MLILIPSESSHERIRVAAKFTPYKKFLGHDTYIPGIDCEESRLKLSKSF